MTDLLTEIEELADELDDEARELHSAGMDASGIRSARDRLRLIAKRFRRAEAESPFVTPPPS